MFYYNLTKPLFKSKGMEALSEIKLESNKLLYLQGTGLFPKHLNHIEVSENRSVRLKCPFYFMYTSERAAHNLGFFGGYRTFMGRFGKFEFLWYHKNHKKYSCLDLPKLIRKIKKNSMFTYGSS